MGCVGEDEFGFLAVFRVEKEGDPRFCEQSAKKVVVGLVVLRAHWQLRVRVGEFDDGLDFPLGQDLLDDRGDRRMLKNAMATALRE